MKRFHVHISVADLQESIRFYSKLFGVAPTVEKNDYAKWMLEDPRINVAISMRDELLGVNHLGMQVDTADELLSMRDQLAAADQAIVEQAGAACCYARSDKYWVSDPSGIAWETFHSLGTIPVFGLEDRSQRSGTAACCAPAGAANTARESACCVPSTAEVAP
jgi:predicted enzyme related to lactoylglutathione lyase